MTTTSSPSLSQTVNWRSRIQDLWADPSIRIPVLIFFAARVLTIVVAVMAMRSGPIYNNYANDSIFLQSMQGRLITSPITPLIEPWHRWDTGWYLKIALNGYSAKDGSIIFMPLFPILARVVGAPFGDLLLGALIVSNINCLGFLIVVYKLVQLQTNNNRIATQTLLLLMTFPTAFYLLAGYTESTFLLCVAATFLAARKQRWWLAAILATLATLARLQGWVLFFPLGWMAFIESPRYWQASGMTHAERIRQAIPRLVAMGSAPFTILIFFAYLAINHLGTLGGAYATYWGLDVRPPWESVIDVMIRIMDRTATATEIAGFIALVIIAGFAVSSFRKPPAFYQWYMWPSLVMILLRYYTLTLLNGTMRYALDFFPIFIVAAIALAERPRLRLLWYIVGGTLEVLFLFGFARWLWIA